MNHKPNRKILIQRIGALLLLVLMILLPSIPGISAKYLAQTQASDSAKVAAIKVVANRTFDVPGTAFKNLVPGQIAEYTFSVSTESEVPVQIEVSVSSSGNLPLEYSLVYDGTTYPITPIQSSTQHGTVILTLQPHEGTSQVMTLIAYWPEDINDDQYSGEIDAVTITVTAFQIS